MNNYKNIQNIFIFSLLMVTFAGCDQLSALFNKPKEKKSEPVQAAKSVPSSAAPESVNTPSAAPAAMGADVLARVGNWTLTSEDFNQRLKALKEAIPEFDITNFDNKKSILDELINQQLLIADAEKTGAADQKDVLDAVEEFRRTVIVRQMAEKITKSIAVSDEEVKQYYEKNKAILVLPPEWHVRQIVVDSQLKANEVLVEVLKGADFAETAKQNSITEDAANGGDLGTLQQLPFPEMEAAISSLNAGEVSSVFKGPKGFYIAKVEEKKGGEPIDFEKYKEDIKQQVTLEKQQKALTDYIEKLKKETSVETNQNLLK